MHEYSIVESLLERVAAEAAERGATRVHRLRLRIGALSGVDRELLALAFDAFRERSICERAELVIVPVDAAWACPRCGRGPGAGAALRCPACGVPLHLSEGDEIVLERIEMEVA